MATPTGGMLQHRNGGTLADRIDGGGVYGSISQTTVSIGMHNGHVEGTVAETGSNGIGVVSKLRRAAGYPVVRMFFSLRS